MTFRAPSRVVIAAGLMVAMGLSGCASTPFGAPMPLESQENGFDVLAKPVNQEAIAVARNWRKDATQMGVMINRSPRGVQDTATFVFASRGVKSRMLLVIASAQGLEAREIAVNDRTAEGLANALPLTKATGDLMNSKKIFKAAEAAGLQNAEDVVVLNTAGKGATVPVALVTDASATHYMVMNAVTGEPMTPVSKMNGRSVQMHIIIIGAVVLAVAVGAAVYYGVKVWRDHHKPQPTPRPSNEPTPLPTAVPTATPLPTPVPTSHPTTPVSTVIAAPFSAQFERLDSDHDGKLTLAEFLRPATDDATMRVKTNEYKEFLDAQHKNAVSKGEFLAGVERSIGNMCGISFSMLDSNQDRGLDASELTGNLNATELSEADTNHDGKLSQSEYVVPFAKKEAVFANYYGK